MIFVDSAVFVIDLGYPRDREYAVNRRFLDSVASEGTGATSVINLLEVCGILSFSLSPRQLRELHYHFQTRYAMRIVPTAASEIPLPEVLPREIFDRMERKLPFGDALVLDFAERFASDAEAFVSWDANRFRGKTGFDVLTPREYLSRRGQGVASRVR